MDLRASNSSFLSASALSPVEAFADEFSRHTRGEGREGARSATFNRDHVYDGPGHYRVQPLDSIDQQSLLHQPRPSSSPAHHHGLGPIKTTSAAMNSSLSLDDSDTAGEASRHYHHTRESSSRHSQNRREQSGMDGERRRKKERSEQSLSAATRAQQVASTPLRALPARLSCDARTRANICFAGRNRIA
eukprot:918650-Rhodomonas_salina.2